MKLFHFIHRWKLVRDTGVTHYLECEKCNKRTYKQHQSCYQPVDWDWVNGNRDIFLDFYTATRLRQWQGKNLDVVI